MREWPLLISSGTAILFFLLGESLLGDLSNPGRLAGSGGWLLGAVILSAFAVVRHADVLAAKLGEPYGTLVLTLSVISIEVMMIGAAMTTSDNAGSPVARDAMFAVVMIVLNGLVGATLLIGGLRYREQSYNLQGANAYLSMIISLSVLGLILPNFTVATRGPTFSPAQGIFLSVMSLGVYGVFLAVQTSLHRHYFLSPDAQSQSGPEAHPTSARSVWYHAAFLVVYLLPLVILSKKLALPVERGIEVMHAPRALIGFIVAVLVLSPESLSALRAALSNQLQRSVNLLLGSVLATIGLTIPAVLMIGLFTGHPVVLGLDSPQMILLLLTLVVSMVTFTSGTTNVLLGAVHLLLFLAYVMVLFDRY